MASEVPKIGPQEGGEDYTVYFDNARKKKTNEQMINLNDPQNNPDMFGPREGGEDYTVLNDPQNNPDMFPENGGPGPTAQPLRAADPKGQRSQAQEALQRVQGSSIVHSAVQWEAPLNRARSPLLNKGWVDERARSLDRKDDEQVYGGGGRLTVRQMGGNGKDVVRLRNASQEFPASAAASKAPLLKETKRLLLEVSSNDDTFASDHLSTHQSNQKGKVFTSTKIILLFILLLSSFLISLAWTMTRTRTRTRNGTQFLEATMQ